MVNNQKGGGIAKNVLMAQSGVVAAMPPDFDFDLKFTVTEFTVMAIVQGFVQESKSKRKPVQPGGQEPDQQP